MAPNRKKEDKTKHKNDVIIFKNATTVTSQPTSSRQADDDPMQEEPCVKRCCKYIYNKEDKTFCERTCNSWLQIIVYSILYVLFLTTYFFVFLFCTLMVFKYSSDYKTDRVDLLTYSEHGVGLSATPSSENNYPLIWYKLGDGKGYQQYVSAIDTLLNRRRKANIDLRSLGPCSKSPFGYGSNPCVILRINHLLQWSGQPLNPNSSLSSRAPREVKEWIKSSRKLWFHCDGYHSYDKEHIGTIKYYPYPPGIDPKLYPLDLRNKSPLMAMQISDFTVGVTLIIECKLWYEHGPSSVEFLLYVEPQQKVHNTNDTS